MQLATAQVVLNRKLAAVGHQVKMVDVRDGLARVNSLKSPPSKNLYPLRLRSINSAPHKRATI